MPFRAARSRCCGRNITCAWHSRAIFLVLTVVAHQHCWKPCLPTWAPKSWGFMFFFFFTQLRTSGIDLRLPPTGLERRRCWPSAPLCPAQGRLPVQEWMGCCGAPLLKALPSGSSRRPAPSPWDGAVAFADLRRGVCSSPMRIGPRWGPSCRERTVAGWWGYCGEQQAGNAAFWLVGARDGHGPRVEASSLPIRCLLERSKWKAIVLARSCMHTAHRPATGGCDSEAPRSS